MSQSKSATAVLKHRIVATCFFGLHAVNCVFFITAAGNGHSGDFPFPVAYLPVFMLGILGSLYYIFNLAFYKWNYSKLGKCKIEIPELSEPLLVASSSSGAVGLLRGTAPFFDWGVYPEGLKIRMMFVGEAFVSIDEMKSVKWSSLSHESTVVRGPIRMPGHVAEKVKGLIS